MLIIKDNVIILVHVYLIIALSHAAVVVASTSIDGVELYNRASIPHNWNVLSRAVSTATTTFHMSLHERNLDELDRRAAAIADPDSDEYLEFMTKEELYQLTAPASETFAAIFDFLEQNGVEREAVIIRGGSTLTIHATVAAVEKMFSTECFVFQHKTYSNVNVIRQFGSYSLPSHIAPLVELVLDVSTFPSLDGRDHVIEQRRLKRASAPAQLGRATMIPLGIAGVYSIPYPIKPLANANVSHGVIEFIGETYNETDLLTYSQNVGVPLVVPTTDHIYGDGNGFGQMEANMDIQHLQGVNPASTAWFWLESSNDTLTKWLYMWSVDTIDAAPNVPDVLSVSYGLPELDQCSNFDDVVCQELGVDYRGYIVATDRNFQKFGALGWTIIVASQDRGVQFNPQQTQRFEPEYPGTSLFVTSVGATEFVNATYNLTKAPPLCTQYQCVSGGVEGAASYAISYYLSGGGFSNVTLRAPWQQDAVQQYLSSGTPLPPSNFYNTNGRGFPDVSAVGHNGYSIDSGSVLLVSGTSMSTPIFAAVVSLLLAEFKAITGKNFGFLNPLLYKMYADDPTTFHDIVIGDNCNAGAGAQCAGSGFFTAVGWVSIIDTTYHVKIVRRICH